MVDSNERTEVEITNRNRAAVRSIQRRFSTGVPRTLQLTEVQLEVVRVNPWLWITGEDWDGPSEGESLEDRVVDEELDALPISELGVTELKGRLAALDLPVSGNKDLLIERLEEAVADDEDAVEEEE